MIEPTDYRLVFTPLDEATTPPPGLIEHLKDQWWSCHPERGLIWWDADGKRRGSYSPQCNPFEINARALSTKMYPWAVIQKIPSVFRKINLRDYV